MYLGAQEGTVLQAVGPCSLGCLPASCFSSRGASPRRPLPLLRPLAGQLVVSPLHCAPVCVWSLCSALWGRGPCRLPLRLVCGSFSLSPGSPHLRPHLRPHGLPESPAPGGLTGPSHLLTPMLGAAPVHAELSYDFQDSEMTYFEDTLKNCECFKI